MIDIFMASSFPHLFVSVYQTEWGMVTPCILQQHLRTDICFQINSFTVQICVLSFLFLNQGTPEIQHYTAVYDVIEVSKLTNDYNAPLISN